MQFFRRQPLPVLTRLILVSLFISLLGYVGELIYIGSFDFEVSIVLIVLLIVTVLVAMGWRWTPLLAAIVNTGAVLGALRYRVEALAHPSEYSFFVISVVIPVLGFIVLGAGIILTWQWYRGQQETPAWLPHALIGLGGVIAGALIVGAFVATAA